MKILSKLLNKFDLINFSGRLGFIAKAQNTIMSAAFVLLVSAGISSFLGLLKGRLLTSYFGVSDELSLFYTADRIPNLIYSILVIGAMSTIFIPVFTDLINKNKKEAYESASVIILACTLIFLLLALLVVYFSEPIIGILSVGKFSQEQIILGSKIMRIMVFGQMILVVSSFYTSILQSYKFFTVPAIATVMYNLGMIIGILFLSDKYGIYGPAYGVIIGALLHLIVQTPQVVKTGFEFRPNFNLQNKNLKEMFILIPPRIISVTANNIAATINNSLAIIVSTSSVVMLKFASQLQFFPVHLFGASIAAASLPVLSEHNSNGDKKKFKKILYTTMHQMIFLVMPASILLLILRIPIVRLVYGVDNFPWEATVKTSYTLAFFSISIFSQSVVYLMTRAFYALKDTVTPVKITLCTTALSLVISYFAVSRLGLGLWILAFSFSIGSMLEMTLMTYKMSKLLGGFSSKEVLIPFIKISYASFFMGLTLYLPLKVLDQFVFDTTRTINLLILTSIVTFAGFLAYFGFTSLFKVEEVELFYKILKRFKLSTAKETASKTLIGEPKENI